MNVTVPMHYREIGTLSIIFWIIELIKHRESHALDLMSLVHEEFKNVAKAYKTIVLSFSHYYLNTLFPKEANLI